MNFNTFPPSAAYMRQWIGSALVQVMACRLFSAKPLPEPMLVYCQLNSRKQISVKFEFEFYHFHLKKNASETFVCQNGGPFVQGEMSICSMVGYQDSSPSDGYQLTNRILFQCDYQFPFDFF